MAISEDLINFDLIESHKENILQLPGGRSARQLAAVLSPLPSARSGSSLTLDGTKNLNDAIRQEYELELQSIGDSDDPLDIYDRYVKWTLNAYPSAQATPQSQLLPLLERATKTFLSSSHYGNDPRYLKLWLHYIRLFSDAPRETFAYLARHSIGEGLGLFYEEFAAWLENAGRWNQANEVYKLGIEREARPAERLMRKYTQFQHRREAQPQDANEPSSPALPTVRPALATKIDPFASAPSSDDSQPPRSRSGVGSLNISRAGKPKMAIFSDAGNETPAATANTTNGWDSIGSIRDRRKENTIEARPWTGEVLKAGKRVGTVPKMEIFKDPTLRSNEPMPKQISKQVVEVVNPRTGRSERVFVNIEAVYPNDDEEYSFEELRAKRRGWLDRSWHRKAQNPLRPVSEKVQRSPAKETTEHAIDIESLSQDFQMKTIIDQNSTQTVDSIQDMKPTKQKRMKVREIKQETQTVKTRLESPTGPKMRRKNSSEPTMTFHSKAATDEIYNIFNKSLKQEKDHLRSSDDIDFGDDGYSTAGDSTGTGRFSGNTSEYGDEDTMASMRAEQNTRTGTQADSDSPWSNFTASKHVPGSHKGRQTRSEDLSENMTSSLNQTQTSGFDTQAIAAIANQDFGDMDTKLIAAMAGDCRFEDDEGDEQAENNVKNPLDPSSEEQYEISNKPRFVPLPPEDYQPTPLRPFRDPMAVAQNRLPFMTPIVEKTESSLASTTTFAESQYFTSKTPSRSAVSGAKFESPSKLEVDALLLNSPQKDGSLSAKRKLLSSALTDHDLEMFASSPQKKKSIPSPPKQNSNIASSVTTSTTTTSNGTIFKAPTWKSKGPIIKDLQCNPCDRSIRSQILKSAHPPLSMEPCYHDHSSVEYKHYTQLQSFVKQIANQRCKASPRKSYSEKTSSRTEPPILNFAGTTRVYAIKKLLGKGAFAPVYLVDSYDTDCPNEEREDSTAPSSSLTSLTSFPRGALEAVKTDCPPQNSAWEFHILRLLRHRLGAAARAMQSIVLARECHLFADEAYLVLDFHAQGTLLDLVNVMRDDNKRSGRQSSSDGGVDEVLAAWLGVELLRTLEAIHKVGILHGDLKADNCLVRFSPGEVMGLYDPEGKGGWDGKGVTLIDFGRGIDSRAFDDRVGFVADWGSDKTDCVEIREARPWKWQIDWFGAAGVLHSLLFGKYIDTIAIPVTSGTERDALGRRKEWKIREAFKRYWQGAMWTDVFGVLINSGLVEGGEEAVKVEVARVRKMMETWLVQEGEKKDLRKCLKRAEALVARK